MKCSEVIGRLETLSPRSFAESWDNVGLLVGSYEQEIRTVMLALDATDDVVRQAVSQDADLLLTHHPLIFTPRKTINSGDFIGRRLLALIRNGIGCYAMHTNFDVMGMADAAADEIGLRERKVLDVTYEDEISKEGIGRIGVLEREETLEECAERVKRVFELESVRIFGDAGKRVRTAAICPGSGKSVVGKAAEAGADVLITGDVDHHTGIDAVAMGVAIVDAGHYGLEKLFLPYMEEFLKRDCGGLRILRAREQNPFRVL